MISCQIHMGLANIQRNEVNPYSSKKSFTDGNSEVMVSVSLNSSLSIHVG